jgi:protein gp37
LTLQIAHTISKPTVQPKKRKHFAPKSSRSWNWIIGCPKPFVSLGCYRCYIYRILRGRSKYKPNIVQPTKGFYAGSTINDAPPMHWRQPDVIFTNSLSDFFHQDGDPWRDRAWEVIRKTPQHRYHILTKRISRVFTNPEKCLPSDWDTEWNKAYAHVWLGVTVETPQYYWRLDMLNRIKTTLRFVSCEPLLGPLSDLKAHGLGTSVHWAFAGGESDTRDPRPKGGVPENWFLDIRDQCDSVRVPFHFLQKGGSEPCHDGCYSRYGCRRLRGEWFQQYPMPTLIAEGPKDGRSQRLRILNLLKKHNIPTYKMAVQTEQTRGIAGQTDHILLLNTISNQTVNDLLDELGNTTLRLQTWPHMPP